MVDVSAADTLDVAFSVPTGADARRVARTIADSIDVDPRFSAEAVRHFPARADNFWLVHVNPGNDVLFENIGFPNGLDIDPPQLDFPPLMHGEVMTTIEHHAIGLNFKDGGENIIHVFVLPDTSMGMSTPGTGYRSPGSLDAANNCVFIDERAIDGDDVDLPFTFGHELGHVLGLSHATSQRVRSNLMYRQGPPNERERYRARKRLTQAQVDLAREKSGPGSSNPILQQN